MRLSNSRVRSRVVISYRPASRVQKKCGDPCVYDELLHTENLTAEWAELLAQARSSAKSLAKSRATARTAPKDEHHLADEVCRKAQAREYSRAAALLASPGLAPPTAETKVPVAAARAVKFNESFEDALDEGLVSLQTNKR